MALVLVCILSMLGLSAALAVVDDRLERDRIDRDAVPSR